MHVKRSESIRRFKQFLRDPELPIFVRNTTDETIVIDFTYNGDFTFWRNHPFKMWHTLMVPPGQLINLRYFLNEEPLACNLHLRWHIERESLIVVNEYFQEDYPKDCEELKPLYEESHKIVRINNDRWRAVQATKEKQGEWC